MDIDSNNMGIIFADVKNFRIDHPLDQTKEIWYAAIEGPEVAVYECGTVHLIEGSAFVSFSDHFESIINVEKYTVMITPLFDQTYGLAVIKKAENGFHVKELMCGRNSFSFDYEIKAIRKGHEDFQVVREKK